MKIFLSNIFILIIFLLISFNNSFAIGELSDINWDNESISKLYTENTKKLNFLIQYKVKSEPIIDYQFYLKIETSERKKTCEWSFIYNWLNSIYTICSIYINDIKTLDKKINLKFEVENLENDEYELEINRNFNVLKNIKTFDWILGINEENEIKTESEVIDLDVLDTEKEIIDKLHEDWKIVIWYINVGSIETYRKDYDDFPKNTVWKTYPWWEDENFLDIKNYEDFEHLILNRLDIAKEKWFDGIEPDNMDTYDNYSETWFRILRWDMEKYLIWLSIETNKRWMFLIQKNAPELSKNMEKYFDWALLEGAFYNQFQNNFSNYIKENKVVFNTEYTDNTTEEYFLENICPKSLELWFISILKNRNLDEYILNCTNDILKTEEYFLTKNDESIIDIIIKKILILIEDKKINLEYLIDKVHILEKDDKYNIRLKTIFKEINRILKEID